MNYVLHTVTLVIICWVIFLQVFNLFKYRDTNGVLKKRLVLIFLALSLGVHQVRFYDSETMFFVFLASVALMYLYDGFNFKQVKK